MQLWGRMKAGGAPDLSRRRRTRQEPLPAQADEAPSFPAPRTPAAAQPGVCGQQRGSVTCLRQHGAVGGIPASSRCERRNTGGDAGTRPAALVAFPQRLGISSPQARGLRAQQPCPSLK